MDDMAPGASEGEQQQARDVTAHQGYSDDGAAAVAAMIEEALSKLQALRERISLLGPAGPHRVVVSSSDPGRRCVAFMETELSIVMAFLKTLSPQHLDDAETKQWLGAYLSHLFPVLLHWVDLVLVLSEVDPSRHTLLPRASQCFLHCRRNSYSHWLPLDTIMLYYFIEHRSRHWHLLHTTSSGLGLITSQLDEAGALLPLVGINRPAKKIFRWLAAHQGKMDMNTRVMSIVGPVGIGKTTLAVELLNRLIRHETSSGGRYHFQCNVMAQASRGTSDRNIRLLRDILSQVSPAAATALSSYPSDAKTMEVLVCLVSECLRDKRYFVIIDDIWKASDWEEIKGAFPNNNRGSRILITTRSTRTAWACCSDSYYGLVHEMKPLSETDSERLLLAKAVGSVDGCVPNNIKLHCDEILRRCDGIPLFIIGMADWLKEQGLQQLHQPKDEHQGFATHYEEQVPRLPERNAMLKAELFFSRLVDRNVITCVASNCKHKQDEAEACQWQINHFMHQFLASKSAEMGFVFTTTTLNLLAASASAAAATTTECGNQTSSRMPRRLALHHPDPLLPSLLETMDLSQTRSLAVSGTVCRIPVDKFVNLVVLDLEGWENLKDEDLLQVCTSKMFFLCYLSVRNTQVHKLPYEIKELRSLEALDVSYTQITELPLEVFELIFLRHLDLRGTRIRQLPKQIVGRWNISHLLVGGEGVIHSIEKAARVPNNVRRLSMLETLATVDLTSHPASFVMALGDLRRLTVLAVTWSFHQSTDRDYCEALLSCIKKLERLESLTIHCGLGCSMEFLGSLEKSRAPRELKMFKVTAGRFASVPPWIQGLWLSFVQITVSNKQTTTDDLKILGELSVLQCLILGLDFIPGQAIVIESGGFSELQRFLVYCPIPWLSFSKGAMWKLTYLQLKFCSTPASQICVPSGISNLRRLTEVALCYNEKYINSPSIKMTVEAVTKQVAEHRNPIDLFINGIEQDDVQEADDEVTEITIGTSSSTNAGAEDDAQPVGEEATAVVQCEITEAES
ncbi:hypothetical protein SORBI_3005G181700 [Sorghum bicolor]|uniref:Uncharacterized protein n=1 Tax=Sorghum bicolor TaxID=4558 RepID=A0A1Z5RJ53_SORBI|nr:hypothetical protein SORBI_3005G181700 [Sorghum bicolor]OQU83811.1 hypothetical protein SORBI_3005G181700 [Sorghum bicolor]